MLASKFDAAALAAKLNRAPEKIREGVARATEQGMQTLAERARENLSGEVLNEKTGRLKGSIAASSSDMTGRVTADAPYARIQEFGGRIQVPEIVAKAAKALAFEYEGKLVFAKHAAAHAVSIPERSYLRSALAESAQAFTDNVRKIVTESFA